MLRALLAAMAAADAATGLTTGQIAIIVAPATIALVGVIATAIVSSVNVTRAEDRRTRNAVSAQLLDLGREAMLSALHVVASAVADFKAFNQAMYGNTGEGEDDERSAAAIQKFFTSFEGLDDLTKASIELQVLGSSVIAEKVRAIRAALFDYLMSLEPPVFRAAHAQATEARVDEIVSDLLRSVREEIRTEEARAIRPGRARRSR